MTLDRLSLLLGWIVGIIFGLLIAYVLLIYGIEAAGTAFHIQNMSVNTTLVINETAIIEAQKAMRGIP